MPAKQGYWKVYCNEKKHPGLWARWFREQCVALGWPPAAKFRLSGDSRQSSGWQIARSSIRKIKVGDRIVVHLPHNRIGRVGTVTAVRVADNLWEPLVPPTKKHPQGDMGRRIQVRWDMSVGPRDPDDVVGLPEKLFAGVVARRTICPLSSEIFERVTEAVKEESNQVRLTSQVGHETMLSDYIATVPHHLEDGLEAYPYVKVRETVFVDKSRADVLLQDKEGRPVVVECKRGLLSSGDVDQLVEYLKRVKREIRENPRGFLVHGGARKLSDSVHKRIASAKRQGWSIDVLQYELNVRFAPCS